METRGDYVKCTLCEHGEELSSASVQNKVPSSERAFAQEIFTVWRCRNCGCVHAKDAVDLNWYYSKYELHEKKLDAAIRFFYRKKLCYLQRSGLTRQDHILDYGCGSGVFITYLKERGYANTVGYDPFTKEFADDKVLGERYDMVMSSDVLEHDTDPVGHLEKLCNLTTPQGLVYLQTPDATSLDLCNIQKYRQLLQQPYHRHIVSYQWAVEHMKKLGWQVHKVLHVPYFHTRLPFLNLRCLDYYCDRYDGLVALNEPFHWDILLSPKFWLLGIVGGWIPLQDEMQVIFRRIS